MKIQYSKSKIQRNSKPKASMPKSVEYPAIESEAWALNETPENGAPQRHAFDLEERTAKFGEAIVHFCKKVPVNPTTKRLIDQSVVSGASMGANYCEASEKVSKKDFKCTIGRCPKEAKETKFFLRMMAAAESSMATEARVLYREANELHLIFAAIYRKRQHPCTAILTRCRQPLTRALIGY